MQFATFHPRHDIQKHKYPSRHPLLSFFISLLFDSSFTCIFAEKDYFCRLSFFPFEFLLLKWDFPGKYRLVPSFSLLHTREYDRCKWNNCKRRWKRDSCLTRERIKERKKFILNIELILSVNTQSVSTSFRVGVCHQNNVLMKQNLKIHPLFLSCHFMRSLTKSKKASDSRLRFSFPIPSPIPSLYCSNDRSRCKSLISLWTTSWLDPSRAFSRCHYRIFPLFTHYFSDTLQSLSRGEFS